MDLCRARSRNQEQYKEQHFLPFRRPPEKADAPGEQAGEYHCRAAPNDFVPEIQPRDRVQPQRCQLKGVLVRTAARSTFSHAVFVARIASPADIPPRSQKRRALPIIGRKAAAIKTPAVRPRRPRGRSPKSRHRIKTAAPKITAPAAKMISGFSNNDNPANSPAAAT